MCESTTERIERLERQLAVTRKRVRWLCLLAIGLAAIVVLVFIWQPADSILHASQKEETGAADTVVARAFILTDSSGTRRATLQTYSTTTELRLFGEDGESSAATLLAADSSAFLMVQGGYNDHAALGAGTEGTRLSLQQHREGMVDLGVENPDTASDQARPHLSLRNVIHNRGLIELEAGENPTIWIRPKTTYTAEGAAALGAINDSTTALNLYDEMGNARVSIGAANQMAALLLRDPTEQLQAALTGNSLEFYNNGTVWSAPK